MNLLAPAVWALCALDEHRHRLVCTAGLLLVVRGLGGSAAAALEHAALDVDADGLHDFLAVIVKPVLAVLVDQVFVVRLDLLLGLRAEQLVVGHFDQARRAQKAVQELRLERFVQVEVGFEGAVLGLVVSGPHSEGIAHCLLDVGRDKVHVLLRKVLDGVVALEELEEKAEGALAHWVGRLRHWLQWALGPSRRSDWRLGSVRLLGLLGLALLGLRRLVGWRSGRILSCGAAGVEQAGGGARGEGALEAPVRLGERRRGAALWERLPRLQERGSGVLDRLALIAGEFVDGLADAGRLRSRGPSSQ
mmetsp:Transcript_14275/g.45747  ORF Transcript_14275/g.45747 Transcript_14275/m.45747 type:complete len:305 (+) Transcript_14275:426-1340(+)